MIDAKLLARVYLLMTGGQVGFFSKDEKKENGIDSATQRFDYSEREVIHVIPSKDQKKSHKAYLDKLSKSSNKKLNW